MKNTSAALGSAILFFVIVPTAISAVAQAHWVPEAVTGLRFHLGLGALLALPFLGFGGSRWRSLLAGVLVFVHLIPVAFLAYIPAATPTPGVEFRVGLVNVLSSNRDTELVDAWIRNESPAIVGVLEVQDFWSGFFGTDELRSVFPHRHESPEPGDAGVALYSRFPIHDAETLRVGRAGTPMVRAELIVEGCLLQVLVLNAFPPISQAMWSSREQLLDAAAAALDPELPTAVVGGFNATMFSATLAEFCEDAGVVDSRQGIGRQPTWMPAFGPLGLDIDHVLVNSGVRVRSRRVGASIGSDHSPVVADLVIAEGACRAPVAVREGSGEVETQE